MNIRGMKSILLTTVILFLSMQLGLVSKTTMADKVTLPDMTVVELRLPDHLKEDVNSVNAPAHTNNTNKKAVNNKLPKGARIKKTGARWLNKTNAVNQANVTLHKKMSVKGMYTEKDAVQFNFDQHELMNNKAFNKILHLADKMIFDSTLHVSVAGYTDNVGDAYYNDVLSYKRAQNIKDYLVELGVNESQVHLSFNGMADPVSDNGQDEGRAENRRVEFVLFAAG